MRAFVKDFWMTGGVAGEYSAEFTIKVTATRTSDHLKLQNAVDSIYTNHRAGPEASQKDMADALRTFADSLEKNE